MNTVKQMVNGKTLAGVAGAGLLTSRASAVITTGDTVFDATALILTGAVVGIALLASSGSAIKAAVAIFGKAIKYFSKSV